MGEVSGDTTDGEDTFREFYEYQFCVDAGVFTGCNLAKNVNNGAYDIWRMVYFDETSPNS